MGQNNDGSMRVYELAKDLHIDSKRLIDLLHRLKMDNIVNHMSWVDRAAVQTVRDIMAGKLPPDPDSGPAEMSGGSFGAAKPAENRIVRSPKMPNESSGPLYARELTQMRELLSEDIPSQNTIDAAQRLIHDVVQKSWLHGRDAETVALLKTVMDAVDEAKSRLQAIAAAIQQFSASAIWGIGVSRLALVVDLPGIREMTEWITLFVTARVADEEWYTARAFVHSPAGEWCRGGLAGPAPQQLVAWLDRLFARFSTRKRWRKAMRAHLKSVMPSTAVIQLPHLYDRLEPNTALLEFCDHPFDHAVFGDALTRFLSATDAAAEAQGDSHEPAHV